MKITKIYRNLSIQNKLAAVFIMMSALIFFVNMLIYNNLNGMIESIDRIYAGNVSLNEMAETLTNVQDNMADFLKTKNTDYLELYYKYEQDYSNQLETLCSGPGSTEIVDVMLKSILRVMMRQPEYMDTSTHI